MLRRSDVFAILICSEVQSPSLGKASWSNSNNTYHTSKFPHRVAENTMYDLYAVCNHYGNINSGHYTACCCNPLDGRWYVERVFGAGGGVFNLVLHGTVFTTDVH